MSIKYIQKRLKSTFNVLNNLSTNNFLSNIYTSNSSGLVLSFLCVHCSFEYLKIRLDSMVDSIPIITSKKLLFKLRWCWGLDVARSQ